MQRVLDPDPLCIYGWQYRQAICEICGYKKAPQRDPAKQAGRGIMQKRFVKSGWACIDSCTGGGKTASEAIASTRGINSSLVKDANNSRGWNLKFGKPLKQLAESRTDFFCMINAVLRQQTLVLLPTTGHRGGRVDLSSLRSQRRRCERSLSSRSSICCEHFAGGRG